MQTIQIISAAYLLLLMAVALCALLFQFDANIKGLGALIACVAVVVCAVTTLAEVA